MSPTLPTTEKRHTLRRSAVIGLLATLADMALIALFVHGLAVSPAIANVPALSVGLLIQFWGNKRYAFGDDSPTSSRQASAFLAVEAVAFALNVMFFHILAVGLEVTPLLSRAIASALVYFAFSYRLWQIIFRPQSQR
jgi:putative flippase GtrA